MIYTKRFFFLSFYLIATSLYAQLDTSYASFYKVFTQVISVSCSTPACHDGAFEPDFRTPQSAYFTLVYHPVIKNNRLGSFKYRVLPFDNEQSVLYERITNCCFVNSNDRMPLSSREPIRQEDISLIKHWIESGAKDICGEVPQLH